MQQMPRWALKITPSQDHTTKTTPPNNHNTLATAAAHDIISLKKTFPNAFDTIGNMPGTYTICTDPNNQSSTPEEKPHRV